MGHGIAHIFAQYGFSVTLNDVKAEFLERGMNTIISSLDRQIKKGTITEEHKQQTLGRICKSLSLEESARNADIVIEAATEDEAIKKDIFKKLDSFARE